MSITNKNNHRPDNTLTLAAPEAGSSFSLFALLSLLNAEAIFDTGFSAFDVGEAADEAEEEEVEEGEETVAGLFCSAAGSVVVAAALAFSSAVTGFVFVLWNEVMFV